MVGIWLSEAAPSVKIRGRACRKLRSFCLCVWYYHPQQSACLSCHSIPRSRLATCASTTTSSSPSSPAGQHRTAAHTDLSRHKIHIFFPCSASYSTGTINSAGYWTDKMSQNPIESIEREASSHRGRCPFRQHEPAGTILIMHRPHPGGEASSSSRTSAACTASLSHRPHPWTARRLS